jgi:hypothetical protein
MKKILLPTLGIHVILFFCWAFVIADLNPFNWEYDQRAMFVVIAMLCSLFYQLVKNIDNF